MHYDLFTNNLTSILRFQIISHHFKKLNEFFKRYIIIIQDFRNINTVKLFIEKYSQISVYIISRKNIPSCGGAVSPQKIKHANL